MADIAKIDGFDITGGVPSGLIAIWHGTIANIPAGWIICDGGNGTPNLLTRFLEGVATAGTDPGATGGATAKATAGHQHDLPIAIYSFDLNDMLYDVDEFGTGANISGANKNTGTAVSESQPAGLAKSNTDSITDIRPKYYDVAFLMKT